MSDFHRLLTREASPGRVWLPVVPPDCSLSPLAMKLDKLQHAENSIGHLRPLKTIVAMETLPVCQGTLWDGRGNETEGEGEGELRSTFPLPLCSYAGLLEGGNRS